MTRWKGQSFFIPSRLQRASLLAVTSCLSIFLCGRQISSCFHILTLILYDFVSKAQLLYFSSPWALQYHCSVFIEPLPRLLLSSFFLTFSNTERFKSLKIVSELSVQCNFVLYEDTPYNYESFWRTLHQFITPKVSFGQFLSAEVRLNLRWDWEDLLRL